MTHFPTLPYFSHSSLVSTSRSSSTSPAPTMFWKTKNKPNSLDGVCAGDCIEKSQKLWELWPQILQKLKSYRRRHFPVPKTRELHNLKQCWLKVTACTPGSHIISPEHHVSAGQNHLNCAEFCITNRGLNISAPRHAPLLPTYPQ